MADFVFTPLTSELIVTDIITIHYFEYRSDFFFPGEYHDFWEFLFVDKGEVIVMADEEEHTLHTGDIIFHKPNEFHNVRANGVVAPNLVVIAFSCESPAMEFFHNKILKVGERGRSILARLINEAMLAFSSPLDDPYLTGLALKEELPFGSLQVIKLHLEQLLIHFIRKELIMPKVNNPMDFCELPESAKKSIRNTSEQQLYEQLISYLQENINKQLTIDQICRELLVGSSQIQKLFGERNGCGIISYFSKMKIEAAKQYIRADNMNFTQISETLGYTSVHYFSRQFKKITGMSPSEYAYSIKAITESL